MSMLKPRQSTMASVSSAVTMTAFDPAFAACSACRSTRVCFFLCGPQLCDFNPVIFCHLVADPLTGYIQ